MTPSPAVQRFLDLIAWSEGTSNNPLTKNKGYDVIVTGPGGPEVFTDYTDHPFAARMAKLVMPAHDSRPALYSTAAGRYQLLYRWWRAYKEILGLANFSPASQDAVAVRQMQERGAVSLVEAGDVRSAVLACSTVWASFPGNDYEQGAHSMETLLARYEIIGSAPPEQQQSV